MYKSIIFYMDRRNSPKKIQAAIPEGEACPQALTLNPWMAYTKTPETLGSTRVYHEGITELFCLANGLSEEQHEIILLASLEAMQMGKPLTFSDIFNKAGELMLEHRYPMNYGYMQFLNAVYPYLVDESRAKYISIPESLAKSETDTILYPLDGLSQEQRNFFVSSFVFSCFWADARDHVTFAFDDSEELEETKQFCLRVFARLANRLPYWEYSGDLSWHLHVCSHIIRKQSRKEQTCEHTWLDKYEDEILRTSVEGDVSAIQSPGRYPIEDDIDEDLIEGFLCELKKREDASAVAKQMFNEACGLFPWS